MTEDNLAERAGSVCHILFFINKNAFCFAPAIDKSYYLGSRFYVPQLCRFMNADVYYDTETGVVGTNVFAYCNNNPVLFLDKNGKSPSLAILTAVGKPTSVFVCIAGILVILVDLATGGKVILSFSEAIGYLLADAAETVSGVLAAGKIPNNLKTDDGKIDLEQFDKKTSRCSRI